MALHLRMALADGIDRGVVDIDLQQKDSENTGLEINVAAVSSKTTNVGGGAGNPRPATTANNGDPGGVGQATTTSTAAATATADDAASGSHSLQNGVPQSGSGTTATATSSSTSGSHKSSGGGGGISTGAIVGIVVGVVGGLLIIAAIAFFVLRKRRQKQNAAGYNSTDAANTYMVDKETQGRATDSPNSPYSDDHQNQHVALEEVARSEPPHERGIPRTSTSLSQGRGGTSGADTPQGMSSNVAHLVEDGMTADEIRRLEEEERQLDDEIERAARR